MSTRNVQRRKLRKLAIGDMRECISLEVRSIRPGGFNKPQSFREVYTQIAEVFCQVDTTNGNVFFDEIEMSARPTHVFSIRYRDDVTTETRIRYKGKIYEIQRVEDFEERQEYLKLWSRPEGSDTKEAAQ